MLFTTLEKSSGPRSTRACFGLGPDGLWERAERLSSTSPGRLAGRPEGIMGEMGEMGEGQMLCVSADGDNESRDSRGWAVKLCSAGARGVSARTGLVSHKLETIATVLDKVTT